MFIFFVNRKNTMMCDLWLTAAHVAAGDEPKTFELIF